MNDQWSNVVINIEGTKTLSGLLNSFNLIGKDDDGFLNFEGFTGSWDDNSFDLYYYDGTSLFSPGHSVKDFFEKLIYFLVFRNELTDVIENTLIENIPVFIREVKKIEAKSTLNASGYNVTTISWNLPEFISTKYEKEVEPFQYSSAVYEANYKFENINEKKTLKVTEKYIFGDSAFGFTIMDGRFIKDVFSEEHDENGKTSEFDKMEFITDGKAKLTSLLDKKEDKRELTYKEKFLKEAGIDEKEYEQYAKDVLKYLKISSGKDKKSIKSLKPDCPLEIIIIPDDITDVKKGAFSHNENIKIVFLNNVVKLGNSAFSLCKNLECIVSNGQITFDSFVFMGCANLKNYISPTISKHISTNFLFTNTGFVHADVPMEVVGLSTFSRCANLKTVIFRDAKIIDSTVLSSCNNLEKVFIPRTVEKIGIAVFPEYAPKLRIYVERDERETNIWREKWNAHKHPVVYGAKIDDF